jgi:hypothetical protein
MREMNAQEEQAYQLLIKAGLMPSDAQDTIDAAREAQQALPTEFDTAEDAVITDADQRESRTWWWFNPLVPREFKRLLTAGERDES